MVSISLPKELLARIDARAASLSMPRSRYLGLLALIDLDRGGPLRIQPVPPHGSQTAEADLAQEIERFLEMAVPALADYERLGKDSPEAASPEPSEAQAEIRFWNDFLDERDEILKLKWIESGKTGHDIGFKRAIQLWLKHRPGWKAAQQPAQG